MEPYRKMDDKFVNLKAKKTRNIYASNYNKSFISCKGVSKPETCAMFHQ